MHRRLSQIICWSLLVSGLAFTLGCGGGSEKKNIVSGKVSVNGKPVDGEIAFIGSDKTTTAPIGPGNGMYRMENPPLGNVKVTIRSLAVPPGVKAPPMPGGAKDVSTLPVGSAVAAPPKYATPANGLTYDVQAGEHKKDFELTP